MHYGKFFVAATPFPCQGVNQNNNTTHAFDILFYSYKEGCHNDPKGNEKALLYLPRDEVFLALTMHQLLFSKQILAIAYVTYH